MKDTEDLFWMKEQLEKSIAKLREKYAHATPELYALGDIQITCYKTVLDVVNSRLITKLSKPPKTPQSNENI